MNFPPDEPMFADAAGPSVLKVPSAQALEIMYIAQRMYGAADVLPMEIGSFIRGEAHALSDIARRIDKAD